MRRIYILLLIAFSLMIVGCVDNNDPNKVIALVNGEEITQAQFDHYYNMVKTGYESQMGKKLDEKQDKELIESLRNRSFDDLVLQVAVMQDAKKRNINITSKQIEEDFNAFKGRYSKEEYTDFLEKMGMTEEDLKEQIKIEKMFVALKDEVTKDVSVSNEEVERFYTDNKELFKEPSGMEIFHILVKTEKEAKDIINKLEKGEDFSELAYRFSTCPSKNQGGSLGIINEESNFVEDFKTPALKLKSGEITKDPVKTEFGYHIIKAGDYKEAKSFTLEEVRSDIIAQLKVNKQNEMFNIYLQGLKDQAEIEDKRK